MNIISYDQAYKKKLLETFQYLIYYLKSKNLCWWGAFGTLIGAIRHHGFIPWDDDIDIYMPRADYERLISLKSDLYNSSGGKYCIEHLRTDSGYGARLMKFMDLSTTIQAQRFLPSIMGVFIDIFPLDYSNDSEEVIIQHMNRTGELWDDYFEYVKHYNISEFLLNRFSIKGYITMLRTNLKTNLEKKNKALLKALEYEASVSKGNFNDAVSCFSLYVMNRRKNIYQREWFAGSIAMRFEDLTIRAPKGYHELLTKIYGDYMTPPPVHQQTPCHRPYYANLTERLTLEEVKKRVMAGEKLVY